MQSGQLSIFTLVFSLQVIQLLLSILAFGCSLVSKLIEFDLFVFSETFKLCIDQDSIPFNFLCLALKLVHLLFRCFNLVDNGLVAFVGFLEFPFKLAFLLLPLSLHFALNLLHLVLQIVLSLLSYLLKANCILFFVFLLFSLDLFLLAIILVLKIGLEFLFSLFLLFFKTLALLSHRVFDAFFNSSLSISNSLLLLPQCFFFGIFKLVVASRHFGSFTLSIALQSDFSLVFKALFSSADFFLLLLSQFILVR